MLLIKKFDSSAFFAFDFDHVYSHMYALDYTICMYCILKLMQKAMIDEKTKSLKVFLYMKYDMFVEII